MREIKFRAWDNARSEYLSAGKVFIPVYPSKNPESNDALNLDTSNFLCADGRMVLEQFTGLKDINGVEIYEGDILHQLDPVVWNPFAVEYSSHSASFVAGGDITKLSIKNNELLVIGNIHETPELLVKGNEQ